MMVKARHTHTEAPWRWTDEYTDSNGNRTWSLVGGRGYGILSCDGVGNSPQGLGDDGNARLIAAAPELLAALKWMVDNDETNEGDTPLECYGGRTWNEINAYWIDGLNNARAAIAKAEGRE